MVLNIVESPKKGTFRRCCPQANYPMKKVVFTLVSLMAACIMCQAQDGRVSIEQDPAIGKLLEIYARGNSDTQYYTIQIGFGSFSMAEELKAEAAIDFPDWPAKIVFDSPTYRVQVGRFRNRLDAEREFLEVRKKYPGALLLRPGDR